MAQTRLRLLTCRYVPSWVVIVVMRQVFAMSADAVRFVSTVSAASPNESSGETCTPAGTARRRETEQVCFFPGPVETTDNREIDRRDADRLKNFHCITWKQLI